jgi:hypothetical protein
LEKKIRTPKPNVAASLPILEFNFPKAFSALILHLRIFFAFLRDPKKEGKN